MTSPSIELEELTIADIHDAIRAGRVTARALVEGYIERIDTLDRSGPQLNSIVFVGEEAALKAADELDASFAQTGELVGPLHGIPVLVKDCLETADMPTTFGSVAVGEYQPTKDAAIIAKLRDAGAIILAKTSLPDFATSWFSFSSVTGDTKNPYDLDRDPGGSSAGTGTAVSANLGAVGIGTDCGGSIRLPASYCGLVGFRSTPGVVSRKGSSCLLEFQDTIGPMTRTVTDCAIVMDCMTGYDPDDPYTAAYEIGEQPSYAAGLASATLSGKRFGLVTNALGDDGMEDAAAVNGVIRASVEALRRGGAEVIEVEFPDLVDHIAGTSMYVDRTMHDIDAFLRERPQLPVQSLREIVDKELYHPKLDLIDAVLEGPDDPMQSPDYLTHYHARAAFTRALANLLAANDLDALIYPTAQIVPPTMAGRDDWTVLTFPTNTLIASQTWTPAITVPAGVTEAGLPVGLEFVAHPHEEAKLFQLAYAFEQVAEGRQPTSYEVATA